MCGVEDDSKCDLCLHKVHSLVGRKASESCRLEWGPSELREDEEGESGLLSAGGTIGPAGRHPGDEPHTREQVGRRQLEGGGPPPPSVCRFLCASVLASDDCLLTNADLAVESTAHVLSYSSGGQESEPGLTGLKSRCGHS